MIPRRWALLGWWVGAMVLSDQTRAGVWGMDPVVGVLGDFSTNPGLLHEPNTSVGSGAVQADLATSYVGDGIKLVIDPSFRYGDSRGYTSVASNYEHLTLKGEYDTARNTFTASGGLNRDSSLSYDYLANGSTGVRRDGANVDLNWDTHLTERLDASVDGNSQRVLYAQPAGVATLTDFNYTSAAPALAWNATERDKLSFAGSVGRYDSLNSRDQYGQAESSVSRSANLQLGFVHQLTELWTLTAMGGYSRALNAINLNEYVCCALVDTPQGLAFELQAFPVKAESAQNGSIYLVNLTRQGERFNFMASASRQLEPSGFAFLSRDESYELKAGYSLSERWSFSGDARFQRYQSPAVNGMSSEVTVQYYTLTGNWAWTERLTLSLSVTRVSNDIPASGQTSAYQVASNEVNLTLTRQFDRINF